MASFRSGNTIVVLDDGSVLAADTAFATSRSSEGVVAGSERFDPATGSWAATSPMLEARGGGTVTKLLDGRVLVTGGVSAGGKVLASAELFDPASGQWAAAGRMSSSRTLHTATLLPDGRVLICGGLATLADTLDVRATAEIFDPTTGKWSHTDAMSTKRVFHTAAALADGRVLVTGGSATMGSLGPLTSAELYDPASGSWSSTGDLVEGATFHTIARLVDGRVLLVGTAGLGDEGIITEIYDPTAASWSAVAATSVPHSFNTETVLADGRVLVAGGPDASGHGSATAELFDPVTGSWTPAADMRLGRISAAAVLLTDGRVLVAGGRSGASTMLSSAEVYTP